MPLYKHSVRVARLPMDGGKVTPVETDMVDARTKAPNKSYIVEA